MASTVKVPLLGQQNKGTVIGVTIGGITVAGYLIYRKQKTAKQAAAVTPDALAQDTSAQDAATSGAYDSTGYYDNFGSSDGLPPGYYDYGVPLPPTSSLPLATTTNAEWARAAIMQLEQDGYDVQSVVAALGAYELGRPVTPNQQSIIQAAIAVEGYPPVPGANGEPPGINVQGTPGGGTGGGQGGGGGGNGGGGQNPPPTGQNITVPRVTGERAGVGLAMLKAAGFKTKTSPFRNPAREYVISATHPAGGTMAPPRSLVIADVQQVTQVARPGSSPITHSA